MTRQALVESTQLAIDEALEKCREEIMSSRSEAASDYADTVHSLAEALDTLDDE